MQKKKLYRNLEKSKWRGVCAGLADYFGLVDPLPIRLAFIVLACFSGIGLIIYVIMLFAIPAKEQVQLKQETQKLEKKTPEEDNKNKVEQDVPQRFTDIPKNEPKGVKQFVGSVSKNVVSNTKNLIGTKQSQKDTPTGDQHEENGQLVITSMNGLKNWLSGLETGSTPSAVQTLESQIQVLNMVSTPTMVGMAIDTMIDSLRKALKYAENEMEKDEIRDAYASMIQTYFFFSEAKLRYAIDKNQDEAAAMLGHAGDTLANSALAAAKVSALSLVNKEPKSEDEENDKNNRYRNPANVIVSNLFETLPTQTNFFSRLANWVNDKKKLEEKTKEYFKSIQSVFDTFDYYYGIIGPSVLIHGMLMKFRTVLVERYKEEQFDPIVKRIIASNRGHMFENIGDAVSSFDANKLSLSTLAKTGGALIKSIGKSSNNIKEELSQFDCYFKILTSVTNDKKRRSEIVEQLENEIGELRDKLSGMGVFDTRVGDLQRKLSDKETALNKERRKIQEDEERLEAMNEVFPEATAVREELDRYEAKLKSIEEKFIVQF